MNQAGGKNPVNWGPSFDDALRACLRSGVILVDLKRQTATLTPGAREVLGFDPKESLEVPTSALPQPIVNLAAEVVNSGKPGSAPPGSFRLNPPNPHLSITAVPGPSDGPGKMAIVTVHTINASADFLERVRRLDRLAHAGTIAAGMAHEIKNALVAGRTFLDLLLEKNQEDELAQVVRREMSRIDVIISRMLRFAGTNSGIQTPLPLHDLLDQALNLIEPQLEGRSISLQRDFQAPKDLIKADEHELHQAFVNLLLNALDAIPSEGTVSVSSRAIDGGGTQAHIRVDVSDTGSGILPEHLDRLFEPFFTTKASGTGLGLAVTRRIIEEHGGTITVQSRQGEGSTFTVTLPLVPESPESPPPSQNPKRAH